MKNFIEECKLKKLLKEEKKTNKWVVILAVIGVIVVIAAVAYAAYRFFAPDYLDDFEDDFDDDFEDDFFEDDEIIVDDVFEEQKRKLLAELSKPVMWTKKFFVYIIGLFFIRRQSNQDM